MIRDMKLDELKLALSGNGPVWDCAFSKKGGCSHYPGGGSIRNLRVGHVRDKGSAPKEVVLCMKHAEDLYRSRGFRTAFLNFVIENEVEEMEDAMKKRELAAEKTGKAFDELFSSSTTEKEVAVKVKKPKTNGNAGKPRSVPVATDATLA